MRCAYEFPRAAWQPGKKLVLVLLLLLGWPAIASEPLRFSQVTITLGEDERIYLDAQVGYRLSDTVVQALQNGVALTFETRVRMRAVDAWFWQPDVADFRLRHVLRYRALSGLYEVITPKSSLKQAFATPSAALRYLGRIRDLVLIERNKLNLDQHYLVRLTAYLDIQALPLPLRPHAYLSSEWSLTAEPWEWRLKP